MFGKKAVDDEIFCKQQQQTRYSARKWQKMKDFEGDAKKENIQQRKWQKTKHLASGSSKQKYSAKRSREQNIQ